MTEFDFKDFLPSEAPGTLVRQGDSQECDWCEEPTYMVTAVPNGDMICGECHEACEVEKVANPTKTGHDLILRKPRERMPDG